ncbi:MAG: hypothetical protein QXU18_00305 [Thermoplasmatales archaeon]
METIILDKPWGYDITIACVARGYMGGLLTGLWSKRVTAEQYAEIENDPLRDYIDFGFEKVLLVEIEKWPVYKDGDYTVESSSPEGDKLFRLDMGKAYSPDFEKRIMKAYDELMEAFFAGTAYPEPIR